MNIEEMKVVELMVEELDSASSNLWQNIAMRLAPERIAEDLLAKLSGIPEPVGILFDELVSNAVPDVERIQNKLGA